MPPRKNYRKKKTTRPKARRLGRKAGITNLPGTLAPQHMLVKLKYVSNLQKSGVSGGMVQCFNQYRLGSIWDPDYTQVASGTSALGISQWGQLYQRYRVYKVAYNIRLTNLSADTIIGGAIVPANYLDTSFSVSDMMRPLARRFELGNSLGNNKQVLKGVIHLPKLMGITGTQYKALTTTEAGFAANPSAPNYLTILVQNSNQALAPILAAQVEFTYYTELMSTQATPEAIDVSTGLPLVGTSTIMTLTPPSS